MNVTMLFKIPIMLGLRLEPRALPSRRVEGSIPFLDLPMDLTRSNPVEGVELLREGGAEITRGVMIEGITDIDSIGKLIERLRIWAESEGASLKELRLTLSLPEPMRPPVIPSELLRRPATPEIGRLHFVPPYEGKTAIKAVCGRIPRSAEGIGRLPASDTPTKPGRFQTISELDLPERRPIEELKPAEPQTLEPLWGKAGEENLLRRASFEIDTLGPAPQLGGQAAVSPDPLWEQRGREGSRLSGSQLRWEINLYRPEAGAIDEVGKPEGVIWPVKADPPGVDPESAAGREKSSISAASAKLSFNEKNRTPREPRPLRSSGSKAARHIPLDPHNSKADGIEPPGEAIEMGAERRESFFQTEPPKAERLSDDSKAEPKLKRVKADEIDSAAPTSRGRDQREPLRAEGSSFRVGMSRAESLSAELGSPEQAVEEMGGQTSARSSRRRGEELDLKTRGEPDSGRPGFTRPAVRAVQGGEPGGEPAVGIDDDPPAGIRTMSPFSQASAGGSEPDGNRGVVVPERMSIGRRIGTRPDVERVTPSQEIAEPVQVEDPTAACSPDGRHFPTPSDRAGRWVPDDRRRIGSKVDRIPSGLQDKPSPISRAFETEEDGQAGRPVRGDETLLDAIERSPERLGRGIDREAEPRGEAVRSRSIADDRKGAVGDRSPAMRAFIVGRRARSRDDPRGDGAAETSKRRESGRSGDHAPFEAGAGVGASIELPSASSSTPRNEGRSGDEADRRMRVGRARGVEGMIGRRAVAAGLKLGQAVERAQARGDRRAEPVKVDLRADPPSIRREGLIDPIPHQTQVRVEGRLGIERTGDQRRVEVRVKLEGEAVSLIEVRGADEARVKEAVERLSSDVLTPSVRLSLHRSDDGSGIAELAEGIADVIAKESGELRASTADRDLIVVRSVRVKLEPEHLGRVEIRVIKRGERISAIIRAEADRTRRMLHQIIPAIREALVEHGIRPGEIEVKSFESPLSSDWSAHGGNGRPGQDFTGGRPWGTDPRLRIPLAPAPHGGSGDEPLDYLPESSTLSLRA